MVDPLGLIFLSDQRIFQIALLGTFFWVEINVVSWLDLLLQLRKENDFQIALYFQLELFHDLFLDHFMHLPVQCLW